MLFVMRSVAKRFAKSAVSPTMQKIGPMYGRIIISPSLAEVTDLSGPICAVRIVEFRAIPCPLTLSRKTRRIFAFFPLPLSVGKSLSGFGIVQSEEARRPGGIVKYIEFSVG